jgi:hypothetical protein
MGYDVRFGVYRRERSILISEIAPFTQCCQSAQFPLTCRWINRDRFLPINAADPLRVDRCNSRIR